MRRIVRDQKGRIKRTIRPWTPRRWNEGYVDARGYFRVYRPDYPKAWSDGYAKRYAVVFWLKTGHCPRQGEALHHKNENTLDDRFCNLELIDHGEHSRRHRLRSPMRCRACKQLFQCPKGKLTSTRRYCSFACYRSKPPRAKLTAAKVRRIRERRAAGTKLRTLANAYKVSFETICGIVYNRTWRNVP